MTNMENKIPYLDNGLGIYLMFLLSGNSLKSGTDKNIPDELRKKAHELAKETKIKMNNGDKVHFDMDGELATDGELFQVYIEELVRLTTLGQIESYANHITH